MGEEALLHSCASPQPTARELEDSDRRTGVVSGYERAALAVVGLWLVVCLATIDYNGPFFDEAIYITAGQRTLEGFAGSDGYLRWFAGSLLWPVLAGMGYNVAGLAGTRAVALGFAAVAFVACLRATRNLFGSRAAFWTAVALALSGPFVALARLGVFDALALAGLAVSLLAVTELARSDNRGWLVLAVASFALAVLSKYPTALMGLPLLGVLYALRPRKAGLDTGIFGVAGLAVAVAYYLPVREEITQFVGWRPGNVPTFGVTPLMAWYARLYLAGAPLLLAVWGWCLARGRRGLAGILVLSLTIWPAYHVLSGNAVSENKHTVYALLFAYPLAGLALSRLWASLWGRPPALVIVTGLAVLGFVQVEQANRAWADVRPAADYLVHRVRPGEKLLISEAWPYTMYLYDRWRIESPWDVYDAYRLAHGDSTIDLCEYDWFVDCQGSYPWPEPIVDAIRRCGSFEPVFTTTSAVVGLGPDLRFVMYPAQTTIWRNTGWVAAP